MIRASLVDESKTSFPKMKSKTPATMPKIAAVIKNLSTTEIGGACSRESPPWLNI